MINPAAVANRAAEYLFDQRPMSHRFAVRIDRDLFNLGSWARVDGLTVRWSKQIYRVGESSKEHLLPGNVSYESLKLTRAACADTPNVQKWLVKTTRRRSTCTGEVSLLDFAGLPIMSWEFHDLFPISWSLAGLDSGASKPVIETLELAHTGFLDDEATVSSS